jgi:hypothetical protein
LTKEDIGIDKKLLALFVIAMAELETEEVCYFDIKTHLRQILLEIIAHQ